MRFDPAYTSLLVALCGFLAMVAVIRHYARTTPLPTESWLLLAGIAYGLLSRDTNALPQLQIPPEVILALVLPTLIFSEGRHQPVGLLLHSSAPIALLVVFGPLLSIVVIGLPLAWLLDIHYVQGLLFGAALAATDPTSASRILNRFPLPERLKLVLRGESIFNDSITIVLFTALAAALVAGGDIFFLGIGVETVRSIVLAVPLGLLFGWMMGQLVRRWGEQNQVPGLTLTLALAVATFLLSERLMHASGIIAVLCASLAFSHTRQGQAHGERQVYDQLWDYLGTLAASVLFFALGTAIAAEGLILGWMLIGVPALFLLSRGLLVYASGPFLRLEGRPLPLDWRHVIMLGGLRGAVPAALVLLLPPGYIHRDALLTTIFTVIVYSIIVHPLLLQAYLKRHRVAELPEYRRDADDLPRALSHVLTETAWGSAAFAGAIAGAVFIVLEIAMVPLFMGLSPWVPVRMIAAIGLGTEALPPPATLAAEVAVTGLIVHFTLSLVYGWVLAPLVGSGGLSKAIVIGLAFGMAVYVTNFYVFTAMFPWFAEARNWLSMFAHLVFGGTAAASYVLLRRSSNYFSEYE